MSKNKGRRIRDITEQERDREALRKSEALLQLQFDRMPIGCIVWSPDFRVVSWNPSAKRIFGFAFDEAIGKHAYDLIVPKDIQPHVETIWRRLIEGDATAHSVNENVTKDGRMIICDWFNTPLKEEDGSFIGVLSMVQDITERIQAEQRLRVTHETLRGLVEASPLAIVAMDPEGSIKMWNPAAERVFGWKEQEVIGHPSPVVPQEKQEEFHILRERALHGEALTNLEIRRQKKDGSLIDVSLSTAPLYGADGNANGVIAIFLDISERKRLEEQLHQAQKMEAIGQLAGGIAHDFNNLLTIINGYADMLLSDLGPMEPRRDEVEEIKRAGHRASLLTRQLLTFSRRQVVQPKVLDLNSVVLNTNKMLERLIGEDIELVTVLDPNLKPVEADPGQIEQVIMNLAVNARDAMPSGGKLTIETGNIELDEEYAQKHLGVKPGPYVMLAVTDTGCGMTPEVRARIFEPFFTTKALGKGTGLGLSTVFGIIKQGGGTIWVYSETGHGTTFKVFLPPVDKTTGVVSEDEIKPEATEGSESILLVEDEEAVRKLIRLALRAKGYHILEAPNPAEALSMAQQQNLQIDLLITDVVMPEMSGRALAERFRASHPNLKVLYISGYTDEAVTRHGILEEEMAFLQKPFTQQALARKVREVLNQS